MQFKGKQINQAWENSEKPNFSFDFGPFAPILGPQIIVYEFYSTSSSKLFRAIIMVNLKEN